RRGRGGGERERPWGEGVSHGRGTPHPDNELGRRTRRPYTPVVGYRRSLVDRPPAPVAHRHPRRSHACVTRRVGRA
ncbi:MAG: hypothetical protein RMJ05_00825, partial [Thermomicrobium sp.]|nr:hypothetical protein [Thermomicrobium sp.]